MGNAEIELYLSEISKYPLLTQQEERECAYAIAKGDKEARDRMIRCNVRIVRDFVMTFFLNAYLS